MNRFCQQGFAFIMSANLEDPVVATGLEKINPHPNSKKGSIKNVITIGQFSNLLALISHASKVMHKILHARLQHYVNQELPDVQAGQRNQRSNCQYTLDYREC